MPQFLYQLRPARLAMLTEGPTQTEQTAVARHVEYLQDLCDRGVVVLAGRTLNNDENTMGIVILECDDEARAMSVMRNDPAVSEGVMTAEFFPYAIAMQRAAN